jgi:hypothetical protein
MYIKHRLAHRVIELVRAILHFPEPATILAQRNSDCITHTPRQQFSIHPVVATIGHASCETESTDLASASGEILCTQVYVVFAAARNDYAITLEEQGSGSMA